MRDASLDEFVDPEPSDGEADSEASDGDIDGSDGDVDESEGDAEDQPPTLEAVDPATPTLDFSPGGADCEGCGETVRRRWRDDDAMVCGDCKEW